MGLPHELLPFAENLYRRFPEEFLALGQPGLEQSFDLRQNGSRTRRISENPTEKTVEITIRRWQPPQMPPMHPSYCNSWQPQPPQMPHEYGMQKMVQFDNRQAPGYYGDGAWSRGGQYPGPNFGASSPQHPSSPPQPQPHPSSPQQRSIEQRRAIDQGNNEAEAQMSNKLHQLESLLSAMMPSLEAATRSNQMQNGRHSHHIDYSGTPLSVHTPSSPLRMRRGVGELKVAPPQKVEPDPDSAKSASKPLSARRAVEKVQSPVKILSPHAPSDSKPNANSIQKEYQPSHSSVTMQSKAPASIEAKQDKAKPARIAAVRMAPNAADPESPRSPGRYSAWK